MALQQEHDYMHTHSQGLHAGESMQCFIVIFIVISACSWAEDGG